MAALFITLASIAIPTGVVVLVEWSNLETLAMVFFVSGIISIVIGFGFTIKEVQEKKEKDKEEREYRRLEELNNQKEHDEIIALLAGSATKTKLTTPRIIRLIERIREIKGHENE